MNRNRRCDDGGLLADGKTRLPSDPCEYQRNVLGVLCGCSQLRCTRCGAWVRGGPPGLTVKRGASADRAALHASERWQDLPFIGEADDVRLFTCLCTMWQAWNNAAIDSKDESDAAVPWECIGHPVPSLPLTLGELTIDVETDWDDVVARILSGACPRPLELHARNQLEGPGTWLGWLYVYLAGLPVADGLPRALVKRLDDTDPLVVGRVLHFFTRFPSAPAVEALVARAEAAIDRVAVGYPVPEHYATPTLWDVLVARLEQRTEPQDPLDVRVAELFRKILLVPLASLSHEDLGPTDRVALQREEWRQRGWDVDKDSIRRALAEFGETLKRQRTDVVVNAIESLSTAFDDEALRFWIAEHISAIDAAARGRWRPLMNMLTDWYRKPALGYLIVVGGVALMRGGTVSVTEFREWIDGRLNHGWTDDAWVVPLRRLLEPQSVPPASPRD